MTVFCDIQSGRRGFFNRDEIEAISTPLVSKVSTHLFKFDSILVFSVSGTQRGRCKDVSHLGDSCTVVSGFGVEQLTYNHWFTKISDLVPNFPKEVHGLSPWFVLCNAFSPQLVQ
ncbi:hypothetical protein Hanom_Chr09g00760641 [Helianthus anomalus]